MKKRFFASILSLVMLLSLLPTAAFAAEGTSTGVAKIGDTTYTSLTDAISAATKGQTVTLLADVNGQTVIPAQEDIILDLNGKTASNTGIPLVNNGTLTVKDTTGNGKIVSTGNAGIAVGNDSTTVIESGTIESVEGAVITGLATGATINIKDGTFSASDNAVVAGNGTAREGTANSITISGGTFNGKIKTSGYIACGVYAPWKDAITISGGEFNITGGAGVVARAGVVTITDGTFNCTGSATGWVGDKKQALPCSALVFDAEAKYPAMDNNSKIVVSGGQFNAADNNGAVYELPKDTTSRFVITGGTFSSEVNANYLPMDYACVANEGNTTYTVQEKSGLSADSSVSNATASATVDGNYSKDKNDEGVTETASTLTIDATNENASSVTTSNVTVSANALTSVKDASVSNVAIKTDVGTLTVDKTAWDKITSNATSEEGTTSPVVLSIAKTGASTDQNTPLTYTLTAKAGDEDVFAKASAAGKITVSVPYTKTGTSDPQVYYVSANGSENMNAVYTAPTAEGGTGTLSWDASHFSTYVVMDGEQEAMLTTTSGTTYTTLSEALTSAATSGGAITLLKDATLDNLNTTINSNVILSGKGTITATVATGATTVGLTIAADKSLTLDGVKLIINGTKDTDTTKGNNGTALSLTSGSNLKLENGATLELKDLERGIIMPGTPPVNGTVTVDASTLTASGIDGNFSNGGKFVFQNGSTATIDGCGSYGISANNVTVDNSTLTVKNTGYSAIYASDDKTSVIVQNGGKINVSDSGKNLPYSSTYSQANSPIDLGNKANGKLTVDKSSSITLTGNNDKDSKENNSIYLSNTAILDNKGTITGEIKTAKVADSAVRITYLVDGQTYYMTTATPESGKDTVSFTEPTAPTKSGYRFLGWGYGQNVTVTSGTVTLTPADGTNTYTFTAQWSKNSSGGGGVTTYAVTTNSPANGTVTASPKSAAKGATVTLTVAPTEGYQLDKLTVADKDGKEITLTDKGNGKYTFTMPASKVEVTATFKQAPVVHVCPAEKYTDVDTTQWYHEGVDYVIATGMMNGTGANLFEPNATTTRGMIVTILYRLEKEPTAGTSPFTDVDANQWYAKAVAWAAANGVVNGTSATTFHPNDPITREQMAAILYRYASFKGYDVTQKADLAGFTDAAQISDYAKDPMAWANKAGLIGGVSATTLQPQGSAIRAQVATILMRFCENVAK